VVVDNLKRLRRSHFVLKGGPTFIIPPLPKEGRDEALKAATDEIMCHIAAILPPRYRGVYADHPRLKVLLGEAVEPALEPNQPHARAD
jgi:1-acyl-sn-glycerol-3-phosphate acyltransferase